MILNYFKLAIRNLLKHKVFTALNVMGLTIAFALALLLGLTALFELSYDQFHKNIDHTYQVYNLLQGKDGGRTGNSQAIPMSEALRREVPGVERITRYAGLGLQATINDKDVPLSVAFADPDFQQLFSFPGFDARRNNLNQLGDIIVTKGAAKKMFGSEDAVGKSLLVNIRDSIMPFTVTAVVDDVPEASTIDFEAVIRFEYFPNYAADKERWNSENHEVYVQLKPQVTPAAFEKSSFAFVNQHYAEDIANAKRDGARPDKDGQYRRFGLLPLADVHFGAIGGEQVKVSRVNPYALISISLLLIFIASVNFINLSVGVSVGRLRETGLRKTLGATHKQLFLQYWGESFFVFLLAAALGVLTAWLLLPKFQSTFNTQAGFQLLRNPMVIGLFAAALLIVSLLAGGYPAWLMSRLGTLQSLKGKMVVAQNNRLRNALIVLQFTIAMLLVSTTVIVWKQLDYMRNMPMGFNKEQVIAIPLGGIKLNDKVALQRLRQELGGKPGIISVSAANNVLGRGLDNVSYTSQLSFDYKGREIYTHMLTVDYDYLETLDIPLVAGRNFSREFGDDSTAVVINETMARQQFAEKDPLSTTFIFGDSVRFRVIGVVKDYHFQGVQKKIAPITMFMLPDWRWHFAYIKVDNSNLPQHFETVKRAWKTVDPSGVFMGSFLDENVDRLYRNERRVSTLVGSGSIVAIVLSCLGLFAIALLVVGQRTREIGIRKVVGASVPSITMMLSKDFMKLVVIGMCIGVPLAWWLTHMWLQQYAYRIEASWWLYALAALAALTIAFITVSLQTIRAAVSNPVQSLRSE